MKSQRNEYGLYDNSVARMNAAQTAPERKAVIDQMCARFGFSTAKAYKTLQENGWCSGRKKRRDANTSKVTEETLQKAAALLRESARKNGKITLAVNDARAILLQNGVDIDVGVSRLRELLRIANLGAKEAAVATPYQRMRTEYPNQVHQCDPSVALLYYAPGAKQKIIGDDEHYKNKDFFDGKKLKCWRYVLTDHYSSSICVRYYAALGENAENMYDFLLYAWGKKAHSAYSFHGLPETLIWDCGSANISKAVSKALAALRVKTIPHLPGNPRAKGQVENGNDIVERKFESRLRIEPVESLTELNEAAEKWCMAYNANAIDDVDTRLTRGHRKIASRAELWDRITREHLRELPDADVCRQIFTSGVQTRKVGGDLSISFAHPKVKHACVYSLSDAQGILVGQTVNVQPILVDTKALVAVSYEYKGEVVTMEVEPIEYDDAGFDVNAPVFGKEYKSLPDTQREKDTKNLAAVAADLNGTLKAHSFLGQSMPLVPKHTGTQIEVATVAPHEILISCTEFAKRYLAQTGINKLPEGFLSKLKNEHPEGLPASAVAEWAQEYLHGAKKETGHAGEPVQLKKLA
jgi:transposase InsO family protein